MIQKNWYWHISKYFQMLALKEKIFHLGNKKQTIKKEDQAGILTKQTTQWNQKQEKGIITWNMSTRVRYLPGLLGCCEGNPDPVSAPVTCAC